MLIDLHADTPLLMHWAGYRFCEAHRPWLPAGAFLSHVDLPRMDAVNMDAQLFGLVALPVEADPLGTIHSMIDSLENAVRDSTGRFVLARSAAELHAARKSGARVGLLSIEGVHPLRGSLERAETLLERGVVSFGLAHFHANEACRPSMGLGRKDDEGLSAFGRDLVRLLSERGALIDLTHINRRGFFETLDIIRTPVFVSHTGVRGAHDHWRNLDDDQVRAIAERGGVTGVIFARNFLGGDDLDAVVRHLKHMIDVGGESLPALGSDYDGFIVPVKGLRDIRGLSALRALLEKSGLSARVVDGIMGANAARLFESINLATPAAHA